MQYLLKGRKFTGAGQTFSDELLIFGEDFDCDTFVENEYRFFLDTMEPLWVKQFEAIEVKLNRALHASTNKRPFRGHMFSLRGQTRRAEDFNGS